MAKMEGGCLCGLCVTVGTPSRPLLQYATVAIAKSSLAEVAEVDPNCRTT
jgi:hypothetical protein